MGNVHDGNKGKTVIGLNTDHRRLAVDFPGWGADNYADFLLPITDDLTGTVTDVESHGNAPYTRYGVRFTDGTRAHGLVNGEDILIIDEA